MKRKKREYTMAFRQEAQNMTNAMLLLIQPLFNFSTNTEFLVQMVLFAQPELQPKLNSLKNRMSIARLKPFDSQNPFTAAFVAVESYSCRKWARADPYRATQFTLSTVAWSTAKLWKTPKVFPKTPQSKCLSSSGPALSAKTSHPKNWL